LNYLHQKNEKVFLIVFTSVLFIAAVLATTVFLFPCRHTADGMINELIGWLV